LYQKRKTAYFKTLEKSAAHANRTADIMRVEGQCFSEINAVSQSTKNSHKKKGKYYEKKTNPTTMH